ncbi:adenosine deaminase, tRNA-specific 3, partial [Tieghemiomyces parasiticus]
CSMALTHSRIGRLFYLRDNPTDGGLQSNFGVHNFSKLNHQYRVYQVICERALADDSDSA